MEFWARSPSELWRNGFFVWYYLIFLVRGSDIILNFIQSWVTLYTSIHNPATKLSFFPLDPWLLNPITMCLNVAPTPRLCSPLFLIPCPPSLPALSPELLWGSAWQTGCLVAPGPLKPFLHLQRPSALLDLSVFFHSLSIFPEIYCYISFPVFTPPWDYSFSFQVNITTFKRLQDAFSNQSFLMK